jgi:hypothetical protein
VNGDRSQRIAPGSLTLDAVGCVVVGPFAWEGEHVVRIHQGDDQAERPVSVVRSVLVQECQSVLDVGPVVAGATTAEVRRT